MLFDEWLDLLIEHEIAYAAMAASCRRTAHARYLYAPELPDYRDANRALRLRSAGASPDDTARDVVDYYRSRGLPAVADLDPIAVEEGFAAALRRAGMEPAPGDQLMMRFALKEPPPRDINVTVERVSNELGNGEAAQWIETAIADDVGHPDERLWRAVAAAEARNRACRLYIARLDGRIAGACDLFECAGWGRIDSVVTIPEMRRRGVATALVSQAITDSLTSGNSETYLFTELGGAAERVYRRLGFEFWHRNILRRYAAPWSST